MEILIGVVLQFVLELVLQFVFAIGAELGLRSVAEPFRRRHHPGMATIGMILLGAIAGFVSLLFFPNSAIHQPVLRDVNLVITPLALGLLMMAVGLRRRRRGQLVVRLDYFAFAYVFAGAMTLVRYFFAV